MCSIFSRLVTGNFRRRLLGRDRLRAMLLWEPRYDRLEAIIRHALAWEEKLSADDAGYDAAQLRPADALRGLEACFRGMRALGLNPHVPNDAREAMDRLASSVESNPE